MKQFLPAHIGFIPDSNRRWAISRGLSKEKGCTHGIAPGLELLEAINPSAFQKYPYMVSPKTTSSGQPSRKGRSAGHVWRLHWKLWLSAGAGVYADFFVLEKLWPDFQVDHLNPALDWFRRQIGRSAVEPLIRPRITRELRLR